MIVFVTSCGRHDLLEQTLSSFFLNNPLDKINLIIHEDSKDIDLAVQCATVAGKFYDKCNQLSFIHTQGIGQHASIEKFLREAPDHKYGILLEDDWWFSSSYNWIAASLNIMREDDSIIKVLAREGSPHPCEHDHSVAGDNYGYLRPWQNTDSLWWCGFSWNPGVTRLDSLKKFVPFPKWEQDLGLAIYNAQYHVVELAVPVYKHIGEERSTHHPKKLR